MKSSRLISEEVPSNVRNDSSPPPNPFLGGNIDMHTLDPGNDAANNGNNDDNGGDDHNDDHDGVELWENVRKRHFSDGGAHLEMVPLSDDRAMQLPPRSSAGPSLGTASSLDEFRQDGELGYTSYDYDDDDDDDDDDARLSNLSNASQSGDDFHSSRTLLPKGIYQYLYPPNVPRSVQLLRRENLAVPACYLLVGLLQGLSGPFINVYPLDLNASEAQQATISSLRSLPSTFKLAFGFLSDNCPLAGYRRKSYMLMGWAITSLSMALLLAFSDLTMEALDNSNDSINDHVDNNGRHSRQLTGSPPSIPFLSSMLLLFGTGFWFADVMGDSIVAEKAKLEPEASRGHLQSTCYACRFFGLMVAAPLSTLIYSNPNAGPKAVVLLMALLPMSILPLIYYLNEAKDVQVASTKAQCNEIWNTVCSRAVWQPMGFVYLYNVLQVGNAAWKQFLKTVLGFTANQLNALLIVAYVLLWLGIMAYKTFFIKWSWRSVYLNTTLLNGIFSALQILLIKGITFGLSPFLFALGDDAFADFIGGIQFLPTTIMMVHLCPAGSEGASYAMFTTMSNSAYTLAAALSTMLLGVWDVSKEAMERGELSGMINLTALTTVIQVSGVLFVGLLPRTKDDLVNLHADPMSGSKVGGFIFLFITFASVLYSLVVGFLNILKPGWAGES